MQGSGEVLRHTMKNREGVAGRSGPKLEIPRLRFQTTSGGSQNPLPRSLDPDQKQSRRVKRERKIGVCSVRAGWVDRAVGFSTAVPRALV